MPRMTSRYGFSNTAIAVKMSTPNGGVAEPIAACRVTITPSATGSTPYLSPLDRKSES